MKSSEARIPSRVDNTEVTLRSVNNRKEGAMQMFCQVRTYNTLKYVDSTANFLVQYYSTSSATRLRISRRVYGRKDTSTLRKTGHM